MSKVIPMHQNGLSNLQNIIPSCQASHDYRVLSVREWYHLSLISYQLLEAFLLSSSYWLLRPKYILIFACPLLLDFSYRIHPDFWSNKLLIIYGQSKIHGQALLFGDLLTDHCPSPQSNSRDDYRVHFPWL